MRPLLPLALALTLCSAGCGSGPTVERTNAATTSAVDEAAQNIAEGDGRESANIALPTPEEVGTAMRASAGDRPGRHY